MDTGHLSLCSGEASGIQVLAAESVKKSVNLLNSVLHIKSKKPICKKKKKVHIHSNKIKSTRVQKLLCATLFLFLNIRLFLHSGNPDSSPYLQLRV